MIKMTPVSSRAINAIGYDQKTKKMKITFKQSKTYDFCNVPPTIFEVFRNASSKGTYYNDHIRDMYSCY